jgi:hypothetical protein
MMYILDTIFVILICLAIATALYLIVLFTPLHDFLPISLNFYNERIYILYGFFSTVILINIVGVMRL